MSRATQMERIIAKASATPYRLMQSDVAVSQSAVALTVSEVRDVAATADDQNAVAQVVIPYDFEVIGISVSASAARAAGALTVEATINGTATGLTTALTAGSPQWAYASQIRGSDVGVAGQRIGATITTDGSWSPVTADIVVEVWVLPSLEGI